MTSEKLIRAMKARRSGTLSCGHFVPVGALIVKVRGHGWVCTPCRLAELKELDALMRTPAEPSGRGDDSTTRLPGARHA